jgi:hypothetical protein
MVSQTIVRLIVIAIVVLIIVGIVKSGGKGPPNSSMSV